MDAYMATELAYKNGYSNGYEDGVVEFASYLKANSFLCDPDNGFSFNAIDEDDLDDFVENFLRGE